ncbi:MAG TPA: rhodanese-like domain-containing protein [Chitinophagaceae bacterium]|nr:rhodanese-like domain-containing protein [Chitinophagaceae bacterium]
MEIKKFLYTIVFLAFGAIVFNSCNAQSSSDNQSFININESDFREKMTDENVLVIDVRTPAEVSEGYIKGANFFINYNGSDFEKKIESLDKNKSYIVYCRSGARSAKASYYLSQNGFKNVYNLEGGISGYSGEIIK